MAAAYVVIGVALLVFGILHGGFGALWAPGASFEEAFPTFCCSVAGLTLLLCAGALAGNIWRESRVPSTIKAETLTIENGILVHCSQIAGVVPKGKVHVSRARLNECFWYWEPRREQVIIWNEKGHLGSIMCGNVPVASVGAIDDSMLDEYAGGLRLSPWFQPDLMAELDRAGVPRRQLPRGRRFWID